MTKRITQTSTVAVPATVAHVLDGAAPVPAKAAVAAEGKDEAEAAVVAEKAEDEAPVVETVMAVTAPAPIAMVEAAALPAAAAAAAAVQDGTADGDTDATPYIIGGVLLAGGIIAIAASGGDDDAPAPTPTPTPPATNTVTISTAATATVAENVAAGTAGAVVLDVNATATGGAPTFALSGADAALFTINATTGEIRFVNSPNFEATPTKTTFNVTVTASSAASGNIPAATATQNVVITLTNVNEAPTFATPTRAVTVVENSAAGATIIAAGGATDPDAGAAITYSLTGTDAALFTVNPTTGAVVLTGSPNFEAKSSYSFNLVASDGTNPGVAQAVTVTVTDVNEAPAFATATRTTTVAENIAAGTVVVAAGGATDPDAGATLTYSLTGTDAALFTINPTTGAVTLIASPNFEAKPSYSFNIVASDGTNTVVQANTLTVTNVNEAPAFTSGATATVAENAAATTVVYTAAATDPDAGSTITYSLTGADASLFAINATTGVVTLVAPANFEARPSYAINVVATDNGNPALSTTQAVAVTVTNVNEAPAFAAATRTATLDENVAAGTVVPGSAVAVDPDGTAAPNTLTYTLTGADAAAFTINATTGVVSIVASPDFETKATFAFNVVATDQGGLATTQAVTLNINDLPEGVVLVGVQNLSAAAGNIQYTESAATANTSTITNFTAGDTITVDVATSNYSFTNNGADLIIEYANGAIVNQIRLVGAVNAGSVIFNEASAEAAVGSNFFLQSGQTTPPVTPPPAAANTIDGAGAQPTYNAANAAVTFTENAGAANTTSITNFTTDDRIVVQGATSGYSFTNNGADLIIQFANGAIVNQITLVNAVSPGAIVFNEASAEAALGADFFRYA